MGQVFGVLAGGAGLGCEWPLNDDENGKVLAQI